LDERSYLLQIARGHPKPYVFKLTEWHDIPRTRSNSDLIGARTPTDTKEHSNGNEVPVFDHTLLYPLSVVM
jgi:hypothetical protein